MIPSSYPSLPRGEGEGGASIMKLEILPPVNMFLKRVHRNDKVTK
jgi:hypothetical protein